MSVDLQTQLREHVWKAGSFQCGRLMEKAAWRIDELETALRAIDGVLGPYDDGYVEEVKKILARSLGGNGVAGNEGAENG